MNCELNKFRESVYEIAGINETSAIRMKADMLFLPVGGKYGNTKLKAVANAYKWGEYIKDEVNKLYNDKGYYGNLIELEGSNLGDRRQGVYVYINFTPQLQKAIAYKNGELSKEAYEQYLEYEAYKEYEESKKYSLDAEINIIEDGLRSGKIKQICEI